MSTVEAFLVFFSGSEEINYIEVRSRPAPPHVDFIHNHVTLKCTLPAPMKIETRGGSNSHLILKVPGIAVRIDLM
jgi:hypothetical protein